MIRKGDSVRQSLFERRLLVPIALLAICSALVPDGIQGQIAIPELRLPYGDFDVRPESVPPLTEAVTAAAAFEGSTARFNRFGTIQVLVRPGGFLGAVDPVAASADAARQWISEHRELFGLSATSVADLELSRTSNLEDSAVQVFLFTQRAPRVGGGYLSVMHEGRIKVGIVGGEVFWVSSSSVGDIGPLPRPVLTPQEVWLAAATRLGFTALGIGDIAVTGEDETWTTLAVDGISDVQRVRPVALGMPGSGAVTAYEVIVLRSATDRKSVV